jgi:hypothetical protein
MSAFMGALERGGITQLGIGLIDDDDKGDFYGLASPHCLITAYRGMHVLNEVSHIQRGTLCACYHAGQRDWDAGTARHLDNLRKQVPDVFRLRIDLLDSYIEDGELDEMLAICNDASNGINVATSELEDEIDAGTIRYTDEVFKAFEIAKKRQVRIGKNNEAEPKQPYDVLKYGRAVKTNGEDFWKELVEKIKDV